MASAPEYGCTFTPHSEGSRWKASSARAWHRRSTCSSNAHAHTSVLFFGDGGVKATHLVNKLVATVVPPAGEPFGVLVGKWRSKAFHHCTRREILKLRTRDKHHHMLHTTTITTCRRRAPYLGSDEFKAAPLPLLLFLDQGGQLGVHLSERLQAGRTGSPGNLAARQQDNARDHPCIIRERRGEHRDGCCARGPLPVTHCLTCSHLSRSEDQTQLISHSCMYYAYDIRNGGRRSASPSVVTHSQGNSGRLAAACARLRPRPLEFTRLHSPHSPRM